MTTVFDVASYILQRNTAEGAGPLTAWKLQKLVYYSQAWSLVWDDAPLFAEEIQAWANGPVVPALYDLHRGKFKVDAIPAGNPECLTNVQRETVDAVLKHYGHFFPKDLSDLTHNEEPWKSAREGLEAGERGNRPISLDSMAEFYGALYQARNEEL